jgi:hypothetical protein
LFASLLIILAHLAPASRTEINIQVFFVLLPTGQAFFSFPRNFPRFTCSKPKQLWQCRLELRTFIVNAFPKMIINYTSNDTVTAPLPNFAPDLFKKTILVSDFSYSKLNWRCRATSAVANLSMFLSRPTHLPCSYEPLNFSRPTHLPCSYEPLNWLGRESPQERSRKKGQENNRSRVTMLEKLCRKALQIDV